MKKAIFIMQIEVSKLPEMVLLVLVINMMIIYVWMMVYCLLKQTKLLPLHAFLKMVFMFTKIMVLLLPEALPKTV